MTALKEIASVLPFVVSDEASKEMDFVYKATHIYLHSRKLWSECLPSIQ